MDYTALTLPDLQAECRRRGIQFTAAATMPQLIRLLWQDDDFPGRVEVPNPNSPPEISSLVKALHNRDERAWETIVVRGYLGRSNLLDRINEYLNRADATEKDPTKKPTPWACIRELSNKLPPAEGDPLPTDFKVDTIIGAVTALGEMAAPHIPWRIYLTPRLDRYIDFHFDQMIAYRQEPTNENKDACTVWLKLYEDGGVKPIPYRVIKVTNLIPSFGGYLGGELVDDFFNQPSTQSSAWGTQNALYGGGGKYTTPRCGD